MPYIEQEQRMILDFPINSLVRMVDGAGDITYVIVRLLDCFYGDTTYQGYTKVIGILECAKQEFYRRRVAPYEDKKKEENGDVFL